jgi:hypothetical protein
VVIEIPYNCESTKDMIDRRVGNIQADVVGGILNYPLDIQEQMSQSLRRRHVGVSSFKWKRKRYEKRLVGRLEQCTAESSTHCGGHLMDHTASRRLGSRLFFNLN